MKIGIIFTTNSRSTKKSCKILSEKINAPVQLIPIEKAKNNCILKYNFIILAASAINNKVQSELKRYISRNMKNLKEKPLALIINCEEGIDRFNKTFTDEIVDSSYINSNFSYELDPDEGNYIERKKTVKVINNLKRDGKDLPKLNKDEINKFADYINNMIEKRVD